MGADLATFLTVYGLVMDGNPLSLNPGWSIGATPPAQDQNLLGNLFGLLGAPQGLIGSHNKYEGDTSPTRGDLEVYGNAWVLQIPLFQELFDLQPDKATANYDIGIMSQLRQITFERSVATNPYFFYGPFVGMGVSNAAQSFIFRFMANHTAEYPEGILDQFNLKSFFGVTGESGAFAKKDGWERIPANWGKRAIGDEYDILRFTDDILYLYVFSFSYPLSFSLSLSSHNLLPKSKKYTLSSSSSHSASEYPNTITIGGNTGTINSFTGLDFSDFTGGVYNVETLLAGDNLACFLLQTAQLAAPDFLKPIFNDITGPLGVLTATTTGLLNSLGNCPELVDVDQSKFQFFPGSPIAR